MDRKLGALYYDINTYSNPVSRLQIICQSEAPDVEKVFDTCQLVTHDLQGSAKRLWPGYMNAAGKLWQKWKTTAATEFTKPGQSLVAKPCKSLIDKYSAH